MTTYKNHYKDREPKETIHIIEKFFNSQGLIIKEVQSYCSEIGTYSCAYELYLEDQPIFQTNGKGVTYEYAKASCYAELYERFCAYRIHNNFNPFNIKLLQEKRYQQNKYYITKNEKQLTINEILNDIYSQNYFNLYNNKEYIEKWLKIYQNNKILGIPYYNFDHQINSYKNFNIVYGYSGTNGLAAGNTLEEALVQGSCELYERKVMFDFYNLIQEEYYYIDINILDPKLKQYITLMEKNNFKCYIYDLSYNFKMPVCLLFIIDQINHKCYIKFGSNIIFNIAVERCITEFYQGFIKVKPGMNTKILPYKQEYLDDVYKKSFLHLNGVRNNDTFYFPTFLLDHSKIISSYNKQYYLDNIDISNKDLLSFIQILNKSNNVEMIYTNLSLSHDIFAVQVIFTNVNIVRKLPDYNVLKTIDYIYEYLFKLKEKDISQIINDILIFQTKYNIKDPNIKQIFNNLIYPYMTKLELANYDYLSIFYLINNSLEKINFSYHSIIEYRYFEFIFYTTLINEKYQRNQIIDIFLLLNYTNLDQLESINDLYQLIDFIYIQSLKEIYTSHKYQQFLQLFI